MNNIPEILFEDNHILIVNKGVSDIVQEDKTGDESLETLIKNFIKERDRKAGNVFLGVVHRLDRPVSGAVVFAKTGKALGRLNEMFKNREVSKVYRAIVKSKPRKPEELLENFLGRNTKKNKAIVYDHEVKGSKPASLYYRIIGESDNYHLLDIELFTGRHHQIRAQLAHIGCPVKGDLKYGFPRSNKNGGISLHSYSIRFIHPVKKEEVFVTAPPPKDDLFNIFKPVK